MGIQWKCACALIGKELFLFSREFRGKLIDSSILLFASMVVFGYFMPQEGLDTNYGAFFFIGSIASFGIYQVLWKATLLAQDVIDKKIQNYLILPLHSSYFFLTMALSWSITLFFQVAALIPLGKLILLDRLQLSNFSPIKFLLIFTIANLFYAFFALWIASIIRDLRSLSWMTNRVITPLLLFSCYYYSWRATYSISPTIGYLQLLNPLVFVIEGTRASVLGQNGFLNFWICLSVLIIFMSILMIDAIRRLKRRTDSI